MQQPTNVFSHKVTLGFVFSVVGALLIMLRGLVRIIAGDIVVFVGSDEIRRRFLAGLALNILGMAAVVFAVLILIGAYLLYSGMTATGASMVLAFSLLSIAVGSGWLIGLILGVIGAVLAFIKK
jgi:hypothetical protein